LTENEDIVYGKNAVFELLKSGAPVECVYTLPKRTGAALQKLIKERKLLVKEVPKEKLNALCGGNHQGIAAQLSFAEYQPLEALFEGKDDCFLLLLDEITDPTNYGAIIRSAEALGADGIIVSKRRSAPLNAYTFKTSAGAAAHIAISRTENLSLAIKTLKQNGFWIYGADMAGENFKTLKFDKKTCLIIGSEGSGISQKIKENCDFLVSIPMRGKINSLNASVAAGILLSHIERM